MAVAVSQGQPAVQTTTTTTTTPRKTVTTTTTKAGGVAVEVPVVVNPAITTTTPSADQVASGLAAAKYAENLKVTQSNIDIVQRDIMALQAEKKRLEEE